jgi:hypothetical protein
MPLTLFLPDAGALPPISAIYAWNGWTTGGSIQVECIVTADFNGDGRDDIAAHFYEMHGAAGQTDPVPNRLVVYLAQPDGTFVDGTASLFGADVVTLPGASRKVSVGDLNGDGRPDWVFALNREDGRPASKVQDMQSQSAVILSQPGGHYSVLPIGDADWYHAARIFESGGVGHVVVQGFTSYGNPFIQADGFISATNSDFVLNAGGTGFVSQGDFPSDGSTFVVIPPATPRGVVTQVVSVVRTNQNDQVPGLLERDAAGKWSLVDSLAPVPVHQVPFVAWNGDRGTASLAVVDGVSVVGPYYPESAIVRLDAYTAPLVLMNFAGGGIAAPRADGYYYENDSASYQKIELYRIEDHTLQRAGEMIGMNPWSYYFNIQVLDLNRDGLDDVITYPYNGNGQPTVFLSLGNGDFKKLDTSAFPVAPTQGWGSAPYLNGVSKFMDINGDGIYDLLYYLMGANPQFGVPANWQVYVGTTNRLGDADTSPISIASRGHGSIISTWGGNDTISDVNPSSHPTTIDAGAGVDTASYSGARASYNIVRLSNGEWSIDQPGGVHDTLMNVERLSFADAHFAIDLDGNAGMTAKIIGVVFGAQAVSNKVYVGIGLNYLDSGMASGQLMQLALDAAGVVNHAGEVNLLWSNLFGSAPTPAEAAPYVDMLDRGTITTSALGMLAAELELNKTNIHFVGLQQAGIEYV